MQEIKLQYQKVFDENGNIKNCTRKECMALIEMLEKRFQNEDFGNEKTGFMETERIMQLMQKL